MKHYYRYLTCVFMLGLLVLVGCGGDESLNLLDYATNHSSLVISDTKGASEVTLNATYMHDGTLQLDAPASRTYVFTIAASPEDATVTFESFSIGIPSEDVEISDTEVVIPAGFTEAFVTVKLKDEKMSFARADYNAKTYELGVKATVSGYKIDATPMEAKVIINKASYVASCFISSEFGRDVSFTRIVADGVLINTEPISYVFTVELDKPASKDVKVRLATTGLDEAYLGDVTLTPAETTIPAGQIKSQEIVWTITDDFYMQAESGESYTFTLTASIESDDPVVTLDENRKFSTINVIISFNNLEILTAVESNWVELSKEGWTVETQSEATGNPNNLINGVTVSSSTPVIAELVYNLGGFWFTIDMKSESTIAGMSFDFYYQSAGNIHVLYSMDNTTWIDMGTADVDYLALFNINNYLKFISPIKARYIKFELTEPKTTSAAGVYLYEVYLYRYK